MLQKQDINQHDYEQFRLFLEQACGIVLGEGKQYLISSRLTRLMRDENIDSIQALLKALKHGQPQHLHDAVIDAMTTNETSWFRDNSPFDVLAQDVFPVLEKNAGTPLRIWSAACSTGQEPYTISMLIEEHARKQPDTPLKNTQIVATDISGSALASAKRGIYEQSALGRGLNEQRRQQFFTHQQGRWQVIEPVRKRVSVRPQNLLENFSGLGKFDVIFCRNVLIYFSPERKSDILNRLAGALNVGGYLFLGASETIRGYSDAFEMQRSPAGVVYKRR